MEDVLEVYQQAYDPSRPVVCLDEKAVMLHDTPRGAHPAAPRRPRRQDYEYRRAGTANIFLALEPLTGWSGTRVHARRTSHDCAEVLRWLAEEVYPEAAKLVLVTDNLNTHSPAALYRRYAPEVARRIARRIEWHYTPEHGSWLNMAEIALSVLGRQCLRRRLASQQQLVQAVCAWQLQRQAAPHCVRWQFTTADARIKLRSLYPELLHN